MSSAAAFLADIIEHPDDDAPRLVYADWLEEHGDSDRAEFIRIQIERARGKAGLARQKELEKREAALLRSNGKEWQKELPAWARRQVTFERGFPYHVLSTALDFLKGAAGLFRRAPVRSIDFSAVRNNLKALAACPFLIRIAALHMNGFHGEVLGAPGIKVLAASPYLSGLRLLDVAASNLGPRGMEVLARTADLGELTDLRLNGNVLGLGGARALAESPYLTRLTALNVGFNGLGDRGAEALASSNNLRALRTLWAWNNGLTHRGVRALIGAGWQLSCLDLSGNAGGLTGAEALASAAHLAGLTELHLRRFALDDAGVQALASSPYLSHLERLNLSGNAIGDAGARALVDSPYLVRLTVLDLMGAAIRRPMVAALQERFGAGVVVLPRDD